ncbi:FecR family protein [Stieleria varia]|uniref:FecR protein n=1 Tax=Stieleria varia TaxID=2528005 RepID=A0A5C6AT14_9BACT|nr:FecR family protein [Stieleria varia]TWU02850.1 FecR protein [Stieleria varia]
MNEPRTAAFTLWNRLISGESLDVVEQQRLADLLQQEPSLHDEINADATMNALLRFTTDMQQTEDQFVQQALDRCSTMPPHALPNADVSPIGGQPGVLSDKSDPLNGVLEPAPFMGAQITVASNRHRKHEKAYSRRRRRSTWTAFTLAAAILACVSLVAWHQLNTPIPTAQTDPKDQVVQGADIAAASVPENKPTDTSHSIASGDNPPDPQNKAIDQSNEPPHGEIPRLNRPKQDEMIAQSPNAISPVRFVTLTKVDDPVWERKSMVGDRLGDEIVRLFAGSVELTFDEGAVVVVDGPIEFRPLSTGQLELRRGRLLASVPQKAIGFTVSTPTSKIVDLGTEFEVAVNDAGESNVQVLKGEVEVAPIATNGNNGQKWRLLPDNFNRASFFALPQIQGPVPVSASLHGPGGQFQGFVSLNGKTAEFTSPEAFDNVRRRAVVELVRSHENALVQWKDFVDSMQHNMQGTMKLNGQEMQFGSLQDVMQMQNRMFEDLRKAGNNAGESSFSGSININGKVMTFKTREEYEAARQSAFGPAATFGIGDVLGADPAIR